MGATKAVNVSGIMTSQKFLDGLQEIRLEGQRVLLTSQLARCYETNPQTITNNYNRNKERYIPRKHFYSLEGERKREFLNLNQIDLGSAKNAKTLYLWTERGALLHAKSLNTDKAWNVYDWLVDFYFRAKTVEKPKSNFYYYRGDYILPYNDFLHILHIDKPPRGLFFRPEYFKAGCDWNGLGGSLKSEFETMYNRHTEGELLIYMRRTGVLKGLALLKTGAATRTEVMKFFPRMESVARPQQPKEERYIITVNRWEGGALIGRASNI